MMEEKSTQNLFSLEGKLAFITGGGSGIGLAIAKAFISSGARVIIAGRREEVLQEACNELGENSGYEVIDVTDFSRMPGLSKRVIAHYGRPVNVLVNNAGIHLKNLHWKPRPKNLRMYSAQT
jgi:gluconate 5-dehydrogenase